MCGCNPVFVLGNEKLLMSKKKIYTFSNHLLLGKLVENPVQVLAEF